jgi:hypothetical protein
MLHFQKREMLRRRTHREPQVKAGMSLKSTAILKFRCRESVVLVEVSLTDGTRWQKVADEVLRMHHSMTRGTDRFLLRGIRTAGILSPTNEPIDLSKRILYYDVKSMVTNPKGFVLVAEGPWYMLNDQQLLHVHSFLCTAGSTNSLMRVSKRFCKLFMSDDAWRRVAFPQGVWTGEGNAGSDEEIWRTIQEDAGLDIIHSYRLRWMSHSTSRLRVFYGGLDANLFARWFAPTQCARTVLVLASNTASRSLTQSFFARLHYLVPESATSYHLRGATVPPLLSHGTLIDIEPSPRDSRSRNHTLDPGTLVEGSITNPTFTYRRLGDQRLTFVGVDLPVHNPRCRPFDYTSYFKLTAKVYHVRSLRELCRPYAYECL